MGSIKIFSVLACCIAVTYADICSGPLNCLDCTNLPQECTLCGLGKVLKPDRSGCDDCPDACAECDYNEQGNLFCKQCDDDFDGKKYVISLFGTCESCGANCEKCQVSANDILQTECQVCKEGFMVHPVTSSCQRCPIGCTKCYQQEERVLCTAATVGYYIDDSVSAGVTACSAGCSECNKAGCTVCTEYYRLTDSGQCEACPSLCKDCSINSCEKCDEGHGTKVLPTCDACPANCEVCGSEGCIRCASGYVPETGTTFKQCLKCPQNCHKCTLTEEKTTFCAEDGCDDLHARNPDDGTCHKCDDNCYSHCEWFGTGAYPYDISGTLTSVAVNGPYCLNCKKYYGTTVYGQCAECPNNCLACGEYSLTGYDHLNIPEGTDKMSCFQTACAFDLGSDADVIDGFAYFPNTWRIATDYILLIAGGGTKKRSAPKMNYEDILRNILPKGYMYNGVRDMVARERRAIIPDETIGPGTFPTFWSHYCCDFRHTLAATYTYQDEVTYERVTCAECEDARCLLCEPVSPHICGICEPGYYTDGSGACVETGPYCFDGLIGVGGRRKKRDFAIGSDPCPACIPFYTNTDHFVNVIEDDNSVCQKCPDNCLFDEESDPTMVTTCNWNPMTSRTECTQCRDYYGVKDSQCERCEDNKCVLCTNAGNVNTCTNCEARTALVDNTCKDCPSHCGVCDTGMSDTCDDGGCDTGYAKNNMGLCDRCPDACFASGSCSYDAQSETVVCDSCDQGWIVNPEGACLPCTSNCQTCVLGANNDAVCDTCSTYYGLLADGTCGECAANCRECSLGAGDSAELECDDCLEGYYRNTAHCGDCGTGCAECTERSGTMTCNSCFEGFVLDINNNQCISCPSDCIECELQENNVVCTVCEFGFIATSQETCSKCDDATGITHCESCVQADNGVHCESCGMGYSLKDDKSTCTSCTELTNCAGFDDACADPSETCVVCEDGFTNVDGVCGIDCIVCEGGAADCGPGLTYNQTTFCPSGNCVVAKTTEVGSPYYSRACDPGGLCDLVSGCNPSGNETCPQCCSTDMCNDFDISSTSTLLANININLAAMLVILTIYLRH